MSCINHKLKSIFIHVPKCGGSSMTVVDWNKGSGHRTIKSFSKIKDFHSYYKWCFVRNPWDRAVSAWATCPEIKPITFPQFINVLYEERHSIQNLSHIKWTDVKGGMLKDRLSVNRIHFFPMLPIIKVDGEMVMDFVGRFENMKNDWNKLTNHLGVENKLPHHNMRKDKPPYQEFYTKDLINKVEEIYKEDIDFFDYKFDN